MTQPPPLTSTLRSPWIWGCFLLLVMLRGFYFDTFQLSVTEAQLLHWSQNVSQAPYLGLRHFLNDPELASAAIQTSSKTHQIMAAPATDASWFARLSSLFLLLPGLTLGAYSFWAVQLFCSIWSIWIAFLAGLWAVRLLQPLGYTARHDHLGIWLATTLLVAFNPLFLAFSSQPSPDLFALGFLLTSLTLAGSRWQAHQWFRPQKLAIGFFLGLGLYASYFWPLVFVLCWACVDLAKNLKERSTWAFWTTQAAIALPLIVFLLKHQQLWPKHVQPPTVSTLIGTLAASGTFIVAGLLLKQSGTQRYYAWWSGIATLFISSLLFPALNNVFLVLAIPLALSNLWPITAGRKYVGTLALAGSLVVALFPLWINQMLYPEWAEQQARAAEVEATSAWLKNHSLHQTTLFFSSPEQAYPFLARVPVTSVLPHTRQWTNALKNKSIPSFRERYYPQTPILSKKWLVVSKDQQDYLKDLSPFFELNLLKQQGQWQIFELGKTR